MKRDSSRKGPRETGGRKKGNQERQNEREERSG
jgi:hypothetical protein